MRIGFDGRWYGQFGVGNYVLGLLRAMSKMDGGPEIFLYEDPQNPLRSVEGDRIFKIPVSAKRYSIQEQFELPTRCRADRLDVFHSPFYLAPWLAPCPVVVTIHDLIPFLFKVYSLPKQELVKFGYRLAARKAARVIVVSQNTGQDLCRILRVPEENINVIHLSIASCCFHPKQEDEEERYLFTQYGVRRPFVLTFSAENWRTKNLDGVLRALAVSRRRSQREFQTVVVGSPNGFREASRQIPSTAHDNNIVLPGFVPTADLAKLYRCAEVFLVGSIYEGFGLPLLEAMSCGCAVISSNAGSLAEVAAGGAVLISPRDHVGMGEALARLLNDGRELSQQRARALTRAADFSADEEAKQTVSVYSDAARLRQA